MKKEHILILVGIPLLVFVVVLFLNDKSFDNYKKEEAQIETYNDKNISPPEQMLDPTKNYTAILNTTKGAIKIELNNLDTPITVTNFVHLSKLGFYNETTFHRVIKDFMIQGGDPLSNGTGGPGYKFADEDFEGDYLKGTVAMANSGPNTNGSQFFIIQKDQPNLPKDYVIFGRVVEGFDVVDKIANSEVKESPLGELSIPVEPTAIDSIEIIEENL